MPARPHVCAHAANVYAVIFALWSEPVLMACQADQAATLPTVLLYAPPVEQFIAKLMVHTPQVANVCSLHP